MVVNELDGTPQLVDGRNRREACRRAGVIPDYILLDGQDPVAYILSANIHRRNMSKGQRALLTAKLSTKLTTREAGTLSRTNREYISRARAVLDHADLADSVINGSISLDNAYDEARVRKGRADTYELRFNALKADAPDLAELVVEGQLNLEEAQAAHEERLSQIRRENIGVAHGLHALALHAYLLEHPARREQVIRFVLSQAELYQKENAAPH